MSNDPSKGVSPCVETSAKHESSEASGTVELEQGHPSTFKPGPRLNTSLTALAAHQQSAALQSSHSSLTQGCVRAPRSCTESCHLDEAAITAKTPKNVHTSTKTQSLETPPGSPEVAAGSTSTKLHVDRNVGGQKPQQTTAARPTAVSQAARSFSGTLCLKGCPS